MVKHNIGQGEAPAVVIPHCLYADGTCLGPADAQAQHIICQQISYAFDQGCVSPQNLYEFWILQLTLSQLHLGKT